jgi:hypothetical protein
LAADGRVFGRAGMDFFVMMMREQHKLLRKDLSGKSPPSHPPTMFLTVVAITLPSHIHTTQA